MFVFDHRGVVSVTSISSALSLVTHQSPEENLRAVQDSTSCREELFWEETLISHGLGFPSCTQCCLSVRGRRERETLRQTDTKEKTIKAKEHERSI